MRAKQSLQHPTANMRRAQLDLLQYPQCPTCFHLSLTWIPYEPLSPRYWRVHRLPPHNNLSIVHGLHERYAAPRKVCHGRSHDHDIKLTYLRAKHSKVASNAPRAISTQYQCRSNPRRPPAPRIVRRKTRVRPLMFHSLRFPDNSRPNSS
ncbi:hypothetical protein B0H16DRAFT_1505837 [Mycena metata]|uniref:Uncharacterized protein n=1 Tax=Mycena metata TaxID=1033252 RepID=A0AAD7K5G4_9AGAR|nr:hypothetical protein B0H16DRAFT_1505837 [Mycena metata]